MKTGDGRGDYVTLSDTLHPNRAATIAARLSEQEQTKWGVVYAEARLVPPSETLSTPSNENHHDASDSHPVEIVAEPIPDGTTISNATTSSKRSPCQRYNLLVIIVGWSLMISAVATTWGMELGAAVVYVVAAGFYWVALQCRKCGGPMRLFEGLFLMICSILQLVDFILLTTSVMVAELLGWITCCLLILFGGCAEGADGHQHVRKLCHLIRWAFRGFHENWIPERKLPWTEEEEVPSQVVTTSGSSEAFNKHDDAETVVATPINVVVDAERV